MIRTSTRWFALLVCLVCFVPQGMAQVPFDPQLEVLKDSKAYQVYKSRTDSSSELTKLIYLIDRFQKANMTIIYDGIEYKPDFVARMARWFLPSHYHNESAEKWIMVWCNKSYSFRQLIWVKDSKEHCKLAREILLEELKRLDETKANESEVVKKPSAA